MSTSSGSDSLSGAYSFLGHPASASSSSFEIIMSDESTALLPVSSMQQASPEGRPGLSAEQQQQQQQPGLPRTPPQPRPPLPVGSPGVHAATAPPYDRSRGRLTSSSMEVETVPVSRSISRSGSRSRELGQSDMMPLTQDASKGGAGTFSGGGRRARPLKKQPGGGDGAGRWDPTLWGSGLIAVAGLALALAWFIASAVVQAPEPPTCISYSETSCLVKTDEGKPFVAPRCVPVACAFSTEELRCPFAANGTFTRTPKPDPMMECEDPFLEGARRKLMPPCSKACCEGDMPGNFLPGENDLPGSQTWQPRRAVDTPYSKSRKPRCSYFQYSSSEVLHFLQANRARIFVVGDSLQKQLHTRLVHMFRGSTRIIDYRIFTMTRYALCRAADSFSIAGGGYDKTIKGIKPGPTLEKLPGFFGQPAQVEGCGKGDTPVVIDSMYSAWFEWQLKHVQAYREAMPTGEKLILVVAVNAMEKGNELPLEWLQYLDSIRNEVKVVVMSTPTGRLADKELVKTLQYRNKLIKSWAASIDAISFVDFDAMSRDPHHPPSCDGDIHWMCWLKWAGRKQGVENEATALPAPGPEDNVLREKRFDVAAAGIYATSDGECRDEMNLNLWQVIFNLFMKWDPHRKPRTPTS